MRRLSLEALDSLPADVRPPIDPRSISVGVVHLGVGAFHRAHQAAYTQGAMAATGETGWGICGASQRSFDVVDQLRPQDGLYTLVARGARTGYQVQASLREILFARDEGPALLERIAAPTTHVVTLSVTEKGYRHDPATRRLRTSDPEIRADAQGRSPRTVVGQLLRGIQQRQAPATPGRSPSSAATTCRRTAPPCAGSSKTSPTSCRQPNAVRPAPGLPTT